MRTPWVPVVVARRLTFDQRFTVHLAPEWAGTVKVASVESSVGFTTANAGAANPRIVSATEARTVAAMRRDRARRGISVEPDGRGPADPPLLTDAGGRFPRPGDLDVQCTP